MTKLEQEIEDLMDYNNELVHVIREVARRAHGEDGAAEAIWAARRALGHKPFCPDTDELPPLDWQYIEELTELAQRVAADAHGVDGAADAIREARRSLGLPIRCDCCGEIVDDEVDS